MNELTDERLAELRTIAEADVSPGPWRVALDAPCFLSVAAPEGWRVAACEDEVTKHSSEDAHFIAAFDPPTVLALLAELTEARKWLRGGIEARRSIKTERDELRARLHRIEALHANPELIAVHEGYGPEYRCHECHNHHWPCPTVKDARGEA